MADTSNLSQFLTDVADAIRTKKETTEQIPAENFDQEILSIETGIDTSDATAVAKDIINGKTAYVNGEKITGNIQERTAEQTPMKTAATTITENNDRNRFGMSGVPTALQTYAFRPNAKVEVEADKDKVANAIGLTPEKLVKGNTILGVEGTAETGTEINNQDITIYENGVYTADEGYTGLGTVTANFAGGDTKTFETVEDMYADENPIPDGKALIYRKDLSYIQQNTEFKDIYLPKEIVLPNALTEDITVSLETQCEHGGGGGDITISSTGFSIMFHMNMTRAYFEYTSTDGITYTRTTSDVNNESVDFDYFDFTDDVLSIKEGINGSEGYYMVYNVTSGNAELAKEFFTRMAYGYYGLYINTGTPDASKLITRKNIRYKIVNESATSVYDKYSIECDTNYSQDYAPVQTAMTLLKNSLRATSYGLIEIIDDTHYIVYSVKFGSNSYYSECNPYCFREFNGDDNWYIGTTSTNSIIINSIDTSTSTVTNITSNYTINSLTIGDTTVKYITTPMSITHYFTRCYWSYNESNGRNIEPVITSATSATGYTGWFINGGYGYIYSYKPAQTQFTLNNANQLLPKVCALGVDGEYTGDGSIYDELDTYDLVSSMTNGDMNDLKTRKVVAFKNSMTNMKPMFRFMSSSYNELYDCIIHASEECITEEITNVGSGNSGGGYSYMYYPNYCVYATNTDKNSANYCISFYGLVNNIPYMKSVPTKAFNSFKPFIHNEECYVVYDTASSYGNAMYVAKITDSGLSNVYTISSTSNYYTKPIIYFNGYLYYYVYRNSSSYTSNKLCRIDMSTGQTTVLSTSTYMYYTNYFIVDDGLEIVFSNNSTKLIYCIHINNDNTYTVNTYSCTEFDTIFSIFYYNDDRYLIIGKSLYKIGSSSLEKILTYTNTPSTFCQLTRNGVLYNRTNSTYTSNPEMMLNPDTSFLYAACSDILCNSEYVMHYKGYSYATMKYELYPIKYARLVQNDEESDIIYSFKDATVDKVDNIYRGYTTYVLSEPVNTISPAEYNTAVATTEDILGNTTE